MACRQGLGRWVVPAIIRVMNLPKKARRSISAGLPTGLPAALGLAAIMLLTTAASALQDTVQQRPPVPSQTAEPPIITTFLVIAVLVAVGLGAQALPSKRGHQD